MVSTSASRLVANSTGQPVAGLTAPSAPRYANVAVEQVQPIVVGGHQQWPAGIPLRPDRIAGFFAQPAFDLPVPVADAVAPVAVRAQQPMARDGSQRRADI